MLDFTNALIKFLIKKVSKEYLNIQKDIEITNTGTTFSDILLKEFVALGFKFNGSIINLKFPKLMEILSTEITIEEISLHLSPALQMQKVDSEVDSLYLTAKSNFMSEFMNFQHDNNWDTSDDFNMTESLLSNILNNILKQVRLRISKLRISIQHQQGSPNDNYAIVLNNIFYSDQTIHVDSVGGDFCIPGGCILTFTRALYGNFYVLESFSIDADSISFDISFLLKLLFPHMFSNRSTTAATKALNHNDDEEEDLLFNMFLSFKTIEISSSIGLKFLISDIKVELTKGEFSSKVKEISFQYFDTDSVGTFIRLDNVDLFVLDKVDVIVTCDSMTGQVSNISKFLLYSNNLSSDFTSNSTKASSINYKLVLKNIEKFRVEGYDCFATAVLIKHVPLIKSSISFQQLYVNSSSGTKIFEFNCSNKKESSDILLSTVDFKKLHLKIPFVYVNLSHIEESVLDVGSGNNRNSLKYLDLLTFSIDETVIDYKMKLLLYGFYFEAGIVTLDSLKIEETLEVKLLKLNLANNELVVASQLIEFDDIKKFYQKLRTIKFNLNNSDSGPFNSDFTITIEDFGIKMRIPQIPWISFNIVIKGRITSKDLNFDRATISVFHTLKDKETCSPIGSINKIKFNFETKSLSIESLEFDLEKDVYFYLNVLLGSFDDLIRDYSKEADSDHIDSKIDLESLRDLDEINSSFIKTHPTFPKSISQSSGFDIIEDYYKKPSIVEKTNDFDLEMINPVKIVKTEEAMTSSLEDVSVSATDFHVVENHFISAESKDEKQDGSSTLCIEKIIVKIRNISRFKYFEDYYEHYGINIQEDDGFDIVSEDSERDYVLRDTNDVIEISFDEKGSVLEKDLVFEYKNEMPTSDDEILEVEKLDDDKLKFIISGLKLNFNKKNDKESVVKLAVKDFDLVDGLKKSNFYKFLTSLKNFDNYSRDFESYLLSIEISNHLIHNYNEIRVIGTVLPLRTHIDQDSLFYLQDFLSFSLPVKKKQSKGSTFIQMCRINDIMLVVDYKPKNFNIDNLMMKNDLTELLNILPLNSSILNLPEIRIVGVTGFHKLLEEILSTYSKHVLDTQLPRIISSLSPIKRMVNFGSGVTDLIVLPVSDYVKKGKVDSVTLRKSFTQFLTKTGVETLKFGVDITERLKLLLSNPSSSTSSSSVQPRNIKEGLAMGYDSLKGGVSDAIKTIIAVQSAKGNVAKAVPIAVLTSVAGGADAVSKTLVGIRNSVERGRDPEKYKKSKENK